MCQQTDTNPWHTQQPTDILLECYSSVSVGELSYGRNVVCMYLDEEYNYKQFILGRRKDTLNEHMRRSKHSNHIVIDSDE